jgi:hypothetical protein
MTAHPVLTNHVPMRTSPRRSGGIRVDTAAWPVPALIDQALAAYIDWREATRAVTDSYDRWCTAAAIENTARFAAYGAALDQEQTAAGAYADSISELERWLPDSD